MKAERKLLLALAEGVKHLLNQQGAVGLAEMIDMAAEQLRDEMEHPISSMDD